MQGQGCVSLQTDLKMKLRSLVLVPILAHKARVLYHLSWQFVAIQTVNTIANCHLGTMETIKSITINCILI